MYKEMNIKELDEGFVITQKTLSSQREMAILNERELLEKVRGFFLISEQKDKPEEETSVPVLEKEDDYPLSFVDACKNHGLYKSSDIDNRYLQVSSSGIRWTDSLSGNKMVTLFNHITSTDVLNRKYRRMGD